SVFLVSGLRFYGGISYGGTFSRSDVYIVIDAPERGYTDSYVEALFHQEFSSVLLYRHRTRFPLESWRRVNGKGFKYLGTCALEGNRGKDGGAQAIERGVANPGNSRQISDLTRGILTEYSKSTVENDFNHYAGKLFMNDPWFWQMVVKHGGVKSKMELAVLFYSRLDRRMNREWFNKVSR
ncbi:hypothetical protein KJ865_15370, partial [Myxococcota bacterium]|nr:hypothetical protein [Myxococcota bacterium]